ncbi:MAG: RNA polymerase factor sigma-54 [Ignavibacteriota bacterium]|jgi:RNA polymerase sigma-54 factor|nr:MAG: RNA polymerase sigma-54 factor [Chlorobiota bacterium]MBE7475450.1 RNA polymerase factor sigma-54 [Ignavibacteriales bacterium]MBL1122417.1 RNA polymerase sigma-54 factor [Ignavibacteriota bacterium]MBV6421586.1 RNA polymerase sigma-54 factor [Ignavibacteriaceae bacterium]MCE7855991.1 RNA polymerase sigma-54 factor [Ignavibacteria bacterium CHB3]MEB2297228.1 RNA polymerase factor sigma-54 [Ignavibacteria bacterium]
MLTLSQRLSQQQKLSPQQIQYQKLLQLNTLALEQRIKTELELNPILEEELELAQETDEKEKDKDEETTTDEIKDPDNEEFSLEDYMNDDDFDHERVYRGSDEEQFHPLAPVRETLSEHLIEQLNMLNLSENLNRLGEEIIGNLDDAGYLKRGLGEILNELELFENIKVDPEEAENLLKRIQLFDPLGIASRNLQECLLVQIKNIKNADQYYRYIAEKMLVEFYDDFTKRRFDILKQKMNLTDETLRETVDLIQSMNPKPGEGNIDSAEMNQISPDFVIEKVENDYVITLNDRSMPSVTISKQYLEMFESNRRRGKKSNREKETYKFLREKFESAKWFIACIQQRRDTLMKIMQAIFQRQYEFFEKGPKALRPMIYKDIAQEINMDISTISRVVNGKYVQSPQGIHELKYFFSEGLATDTGDEVSNKHIKERLKEIIDREDKRKPFSDDKLAELLNDEGIHIARRTVAKYREQLRLPVARLRKELS